jgi:hypothetical protein
MLLFFSFMAGKGGRVRGNATNVALPKEGTCGQGSIAGPRHKDTPGQAGTALDDVKQVLNTVALSPVCTSQSPPTFTERLFEWKTLHESLTRIAAGLNDETLVSKDGILAHAYTPVINRHNIDR